MLGVGRIEGVGHEAVDPRRDAADAVGHRAVETHGGAERAAGNLERADQGNRHGARPATLVTAPAVIDRLAQGDGDGTEGQHHAVDLDRLADTGLVGEFIGDAANGCRRHVTDRRRPFGRIRRHVRGELAERGFAGKRAAGDLFAVGTQLDRRSGEAAFQRRLRVRRIVSHRRAALAIPDQRLLAFGIAQIGALGADEIGRRRAVRQEGEVEARALLLVQQHMDDGIEKSRVGLRPDRNPFGGAGAGDREMRLHLDALHPAGARIGMAFHADDAARGLGVAAERDDVAAGRRIRRDREGVMPQLAVEMFRVIALDALAAAETHIDRPPGREKGGKGSHVGLRRAPAAEGGGDLGIARGVEQAAGAHAVELFGDEIERFIPGDRDEARLLAAPLFLIGALHRRENAIGVVGLLHQPIGLDANPPRAGMNLRGAKIRIDAERDSVLDADGQEIGTGDALVAVGRNLLCRGRRSRHEEVVPAAFAFAALALSRSTVF